MDVEEIGQHWCGQVGGEGDQGCGARRSGVDALMYELVVGRFAAEWLARHDAGEQPRGLVGEGSGQGRALAWRVGELVKEFGQAGWDPQSRLAEFEERLSHCGAVDLVGGQVSQAFAGDAVEEDEGAGDANLQR
ncbi:hypothetical protein AB0D63_42485 [Kitasatospora sp. NPDC048343]|uniref:hypothetical protein n=1 Tax=Kitasatospora sp. NPDC048343 TaxID=3154717 RepID=UPI0033E2C418